MATPVFSVTGKPRGIIIINIAAQKTLEAFSQSAGPAAAKRLMLLNQSGYWLKSPDSQQEWGFMFQPPSARFSDLHPAAWNLISTHKQGQARLADGLWSWQTVNPVPEQTLPGANDIRWKVVTHVDNQLLSNIEQRIWLHGAIGASILLLLFGSGTWLLTTSRASRINAEKEAILARSEAAAAKQLQEANHRFRLLFEANTNALLVVNTDGRIVMSNPPCEKLFGYPNAELLHLPIETLLPASPQQTEKAPVRYAKRKDGSLFPVDVVFSPYEDQAQPFTLTTVIDISERKRVQDELIQLKNNLEIRVTERTAELQAANQELDSFAYAIAHDLRAPLRAMTGFSEALIEDYGAELPDEAKLYLDQIMAGSQRMKELVEGLLVLSRSTRGEIQRERVDLSGMAKRLLEELAHEEPERKVRWEIDPALYANGDPRMLEAVMGNMLNNAWKYTANTSNAEIKVAAKNNHPEQLICISDNGAGFDMAHAAKLFQPFQRLHRQEEYTGTGIGLATVQRIIHRHGGQIHAESEPGQGARFYFSFEPADTISKDRTT